MSSILDHAQRYAKESPKRERSSRARQSTISTCANRHAALVQLKRWLSATLKPSVVSVNEMRLIERDLEIAAKAYFKMDRVVKVKP